MSDYPWYVFFLILIVISLIFAAEIESTRVGNLMQKFCEERDMLYKSFDGKGSCCDVAGYVVECKEITVINNTVYFRGESK